MGREYYNWNAGNEGYKMKEGDEGEEEKRRRPVEKLRKANKLVGRDQRDGERKVRHVSPHANFPVAFVRQPFSLTQNARGKQRERERRRAFGHSDELNQAIRRHVRLELNVFVRFSSLVSTH